MNEIECLVDCLGTAQWRRMKANQFPWDAKRNETAAEILERLAPEVAGLSWTPLHQRLYALWEERDDFLETISDGLRSVGFHLFPETGLELIESLICCF